MDQEETNATYGMNKRFKTSVINTVKTVATSRSAELLAKTFTGHFGYHWPGRGGGVDCARGTVDRVSVEVDFPGLSFDWA